MHPDAPEMSVDPRDASPAQRAYTVHVADAGRMVYLPALLVALGLPSGGLSRHLRSQGLTVRIRARTRAARRTLSDLAGRGPELMQPLARVDGGYVICTSRGELLDVVGELLASSGEQERHLGYELQATLRNAFEPLRFGTTIGRTRFAWGQRTYVMGIINVTPDSFSGDGLLAGAVDLDRAIDAAVERALEFEQSGADLLDIGAESTRPGAQSITAEEEMARLIPAVEAIRQATTLPLSVDTYKAQVAEAALAAGADLINDVHGLRGDAAMGTAISRASAPVVLMHNRTGARTMTDAALGGRYLESKYDDLLLDVLEETGALLDHALALGIDRSKILLDPGLGFGKTVEQSLRLASQCDALRGLGQPTLYGPSRKSFLGYTLRTPPDRRLQGTMAAIAIALARGAADIVRVHDVQAAVETVRTADAIMAAMSFSGSLTGG